MTRTIAWNLTLLLATVSTAQSKVETEVSVDMPSKYVWRGINLVNETVIQPSITFTHGRFSAGVWANYETGNWNLPNYDSAPQRRVTEIDVTAEYAFRYQAVDCRLGIIDYQYPGTGFERYSETYVAAALNDLPFSPELTIFRGNRHFTGLSGTLSLSHAVPLSNSTLDLSLELGYGDAKNNEFQYGARVSTLSHAQIGASTEFAIGGNWQLTPSVHFSTLLDRRLLQGEPRRSNAWVQLGIKKRF